MRILLIAYDNGSYINWFAQGLGYLAATLEANGHYVEIYEEGISHKPETELTALLDNRQFDIVGLSMIAGYYQYRKIISLSNAINASVNRNRFKYIIGGHMVASEPEYFLSLTKCDAIFIGEGEQAILDYIKEPKRIMQADQIQDVDTIPMPAYHLFNMEHYRLLRMPHSTSTDFIMPILSGRGCTFKCNFCFRLMEGCRVRSADSILKEIAFLMEEYGITYFSFSDELLMVSKKRTTELCQAFIDSGLKFKWDCNGRLNYATPEVLNIMKESGCQFINYGIEAVDDTVLKNMNKCLTVKQIVVGIENTLACGISPGFNIIWGNIGDTVETLNKGMDFLLKYDNGSQMRTIRPVTPYPGTPLFDYAIEKGLIKDVKDFYENKHVNSDLVSVNFTGISDEQFHKELYRVNTILINNYFKNKAESFQKQSYNLYVGGNVAFRGFRQS